MNNKQEYARPGMTLIEVLLVIALMGIVLVPLFSLQEQSVFSIMNITNEYDDYIQLIAHLEKQRIMYGEQKPENSGEKNSIDTQVSMELKEIAHESSLAPYKGLFAHKATITKKNKTRAFGDSPKQPASIVLLTYKPEWVTHEKTGIHPH